MSRGVPVLPGRSRQAQPEEWRLHAACRGRNPALFFWEGVAPPSRVEKAREVCAVCPVMADCLAYALTGDEQHGMWGGATRGEREVLLGHARGDVAGAVELAVRLWARQAGGAR